MEQFNTIIANLLNINERQIGSTIKLITDGATVPFISRYRKEATGQLDEIQVQAIKDEYEKLCEIAKRKETILKTIAEQEKLTSKIENAISACWDSHQLEDIYLPYKPKRRTKAEIAKKKGLEPLANLILLQQKCNLSQAIQSFINKDVMNEEEALQGAKDIIAERVNEDNKVRNIVRQAFSRNAIITAKVIKKKEESEEAAKYKDYFNFQENLKRCGSHKILAMRRGEHEGVLNVAIVLEDYDFVINKIKHLYIKRDNNCAKEIEIAIEDSFKRLIKPAIETEYANLSKDSADDDAIKVFSKNLQQLLLAPPLGQKRILAIDPGYRTGCKVVCLNELGELVHNENIYPHPPVNKASQAAGKVRKMVEAYNIEAIAIGNGTASRETEEFINRQQFDRVIPVFVVSEQGASIYSASKIAREEFPDYDVTVRGAVSIGRRLMDPLAELVKIDPKSIGVGQYQHDVNQTKLKKALDQTIEHCVNLVGVNVNTASKHILTYISGLGNQLAQNIVDYRTKNGEFKSRKELLNVPRMGQKAYEQAAGFLRISKSKNPLDNSAVHPESYYIVEKMAGDLHCTIQDILKEKTLRDKIDIEKYRSETVGLPTLKDILEELNKPGRDPRKEIKVFEFDKSIRKITDLKEGMELPGIVGNITNFGAFVDIGIKENGLIHLSQIAERFIKDPSEELSIHQQVRVRVIGIDFERKRIQLSMIGVNQD